MHTTSSVQQSVYKEFAVRRLPTEVSWLNYHHLHISCIYHYILDTVVHVLVSETENVTSFELIT